jgi:hypothetical protein
MHVVCNSVERSHIHCCNVKATLSCVLLIYTPLSTIFKHSVLHKNAFIAFYIAGINKTYLGLNV